MLSASAGEKVSDGAIRVRGAWSSASDSVTALPEGGKQIGAVYRNEYFGFVYAASRGWIERFEGPPPSDSGYYVLAQLEPAYPLRNSKLDHLMISAQDMFFTMSTSSNAIELLSYAKDHLDSDFKVERAPTTVRIADHTFIRFDYTSSVSGLHWHVLATDIRCHVVQFIFTGRDDPLMIRLVQDMNGMSLSTEAGHAPVCIKDYARGEYLIAQEDPVFSEPRFNSVPVRIIVDTHGKVSHIHFLCAFPDQVKSISDALSKWRFKPYFSNGQPVEVETGILFGRAAGRITAGSNACRVQTTSARIGRSGVVFDHLEDANEPQDKCGIFRSCLTRFTEACDVGTAHTKSPRQG
jgi:hypothetical protein